MWDIQVVAASTSIRTDRLLCVSFLFCFAFVLRFFFSIYLFRGGFLCVSLAVLELAGFHLTAQACFYFPSAGIKTAPTPTWFFLFFSFPFFFFFFFLFEASSYYIVLGGLETTFNFWPSSCLCLLSTEILSKGSKYHHMGFRACFISLHFLKLKAQRFIHCLSWGWGLRVKHSPTSQDLGFMASTGWLVGWLVGWVCFCFFKQVNSHCP